jgi:hypothetical protein
MPRRRSADRRGRRPDPRSAARSRWDTRRRELPARVCVVPRVPSPSDRRADVAGAPPHRHGRRPDRPGDRRRRCRAGARRLPSQRGDGGVREAARRVRPSRGCARPRRRVEAPRPRRRPRLVVQRGRPEALSRSARGEGHRRRLDDLRRRRANEAAPGRDSRGSREGWDCRGRDGRRLALGHRGGRERRPRDGLRDHGWVVRAGAPRPGRGRSLRIARRAQGASGGDAARPRPSADTMGAARWR